MPPPNRAVVGIRSAARSLKAAVRSLYQRLTRCRDADTEASAGEEKTAKKALEEYRQVMQSTFGSSELLDDVEFINAQIYVWQKSNGGSMASE